MNLNRYRYLLRILAQNVLFRFKIFVRKILRKK